MEDYREIKGMNWSSLKQMDVSPMAYQWSREHPRKDEPFLSLGRIVHMAILQPELFDKTCVKRPETWDSWRTKKSQEWRDEQTAQGKEVITDENAKTLRGILTNLSAHREASILNNTRKETPVTWHDKGVLCKARVDAASSDRLIEVKTTHDLTSFVRYDFFKHLYHGQIAWYLDGLITANICSHESNVYMIVCETKPPFDVAIFEISDETITYGRQLKTRLFDTWIACKEANIWPGRYPSMTVFDPPNWYQDKEMYDEDLLEE